MTEFEISPDFLVVSIKEIDSLVVGDRTNVWTRPESVRLSLLIEFYYYLILKGVTFSTFVSGKKSDIVRAAGGFILPDLAKRFDLCILILGSYEG